MSYKQQKSGQVQPDLANRASYALRLKDNLALLYSKETAAIEAERLLELVPNTFQQPVTRATNRCMLITYADTIRAPDMSPVQALDAFLSLHVQGHLDTVHLLPFFPSSSDDGFAVVDYLRVDHHTGSWQDIAQIAQKYHLMFDLVINHCSRENLWFADFVSGREPGKDFFITLPEESDVSAVIRPRSTPLVSAVPTYAGIRHVWNTFSDDQIDLNFANPEVLRAFVEILFSYISQGASLIRLDAIGFLWKRLGTSCMHLPETHAVVRILRLLVDYSQTKVELVSETNVPHAENVSYFGDSNEAHLVYQFSLAPLLLYSYVFGDARALTRWATELAPAPPGCTFLNFFASHDGIGLRPAEGFLSAVEIAALVDKMHARGGFVTLRQGSDGEPAPYEINISLFSAFGGTVDDLPGYLGAHALLLSFCGLPGLYIHSLLATHNDLELVELTGRTRSINRGHWQLSDVTAAVQDADSLHGRALRALLHLVDVRSLQPAFHTDSAQQVYDLGSSVVVLERRCSTQRLLVVASVSPSGQRVPLTSIPGLPQRATDLLGGQQQELAQPLSLEPYQVMWLEL